MKTIICIIVLIIANGSSMAGELSLIKFDSENYDQNLADIIKMESKGAVIRHIFAPNHAIVDFSKFKKDNDFSFNQINSNEIDVSIKSSKFQRKYIDVLAMLSSTVPKHIPQNKDFNDDIGFIKESKIDIKSKALTDVSDRLTGQYMIGYIAVGIYLMESNGSQENWWAEAEQITFVEIVEGLDYLSREAYSRGVKIVWVYPPVEKIYTDHEPIDGSAVPSIGSFSNWIFDWLDDIYTSHGLTDEWDGAYALANKLRQDYKTNWAVEIALVMNENDEDKMFDDGRIAYHAPHEGSMDSEHRSPIIVMGYYNDGWEPQELNFVVIHETSHAFGALDEYASSSCDNSDDCDLQHSYLYTTHGNCFYCNDGSEYCYMKALDTIMCDFTAQHLGWRDSDGDGAMDPIDPNTGKLMWIYPVAPGDIIQISTITGSFINLFTVTEDMICYDIAIIWYGEDYARNVMPAHYYYVSKNGTILDQFELALSPGGTSPITNHSFSLDNLSFRTPNVTMYLRNTIYDSLNNVVLRPYFDKMTNDNITVNLDLLGLPDGIYISELSGWRGDGVNAPTNTLQFINYLCADLNNDGIAGDIGDQVYMVDYQFRGGPPPLHMASADLNCMDGIDIEDLVYLIDYMFHGGPEPFCCHSLD